MEANMVGGWQHLPLPALTVSRMDQVGSWQPLTISDVTGSDHLWQNGKRPEVSPRRGGGLTFDGIGKRKVLPKPTSMSIEETLSLRRSLRQSKSSPLLLLGGEVGFSQSFGASSGRLKPDVTQMPRTITPTPVCVSLGTVGRQDGWHALLTGAQKIDLPAQVENTDECVSWYRRKELENRCSLPCAEATEEASTWLTSSGASPSSSSWALPDSRDQSQMRSGFLASRSPSQSVTLGAWQQLPPDTVPKFTSTFGQGWKQVRVVSVWAQQARQIASWRVGLASRPSASRDRSTQERLKLLDLLERQGVKQGREALRAALRLRFGGLEQAFRYLDVAGRGQGPSMLEMSGSLALLGLDVQSLCGQSDCEVFALLDVDRNGRIGLEDLLGTSFAPRGGDILQAPLKYILQESDSWQVNVDDEDIDGPEKWALLAKFVALSSWFDTPAPLRQRGRPDALQPASVSFSLALKNINYARLSANKPLLSVVTATLKEGLLREAGAGILPEQVRLKLAAGPFLMIEGRIALPDELLAESLYLKLKASSTLSDGVAGSVQDIVGIESVITGLVIAINLRVSKTKDAASSNQPKIQSSTPVVSPPGFGAIGGGLPTGGSDFHTLKFEKVLGSGVPDGWRLATHTEVRAFMSDIVLLMDEWDVCGLAGGWRFDGPGYGHNLKQPYGAVDFSMIIVCQKICDTTVSSDVTTITTVPSASQKTTTRTQGVGGQVGVFDRQQAMDILRKCWSPNEGDLESARRIVLLQFMDRASSRQFGEPLLSRSDVTHLLGTLPPPGLGGSRNASAASPRQPCPTVAEVGELYNHVLNMQVMLTSRAGRALSKGLTFESLCVLLQKVALSLGLHFRHIVDDAVETFVESTLKL